MFHSQPTKDNIFTIENKLVNNSSIRKWFVSFNRKDKINHRNSVKTYSLNQDTVRDVLSKLSNGKSEGFANISSEMYKNAKNIKFIAF